MSNSITHLKIGACVGIAFLGFSAAANAVPLYLTCTIQNTNIKTYIIVDYATRTVQISLDGSTFLKDEEGREAMPAKITNSSISWQIDYSHSRRLTTRWTINRLTGAATAVDSGSGALYPNDPYIFTCERGRRPAPKF